MLGDYIAGSILDNIMFPSMGPTGMATLSGSPVVSVYKDSSLTQTTTGVTLSVDYDNVTGLNKVKIDTSADGTFYASGSHFSIVVTTGTVASVNVAGQVIEEFSIGTGYNINLSQALATAPAATTGAQSNTVGEALLAARAQGFGKWAIVGSNLILYGPDGTTPWRSFALDSTSSPTSRT